MDLISRLIGVHKLFVLNFYPYLQRYLQPHVQRALHRAAGRAGSCRRIGD